MVWLGLDKKDTLIGLGLEKDRQTNQINFIYTAQNHNHIA